jgi:hypothetical protein
MRLRRGRNFGDEAARTTQKPCRNANGGRGRESLAPTHYSPRCLRRGRRANHQTEMIEAKAPSTPIVDLTPFPFWFSAITHRNEQNAGDAVPGVSVALTA